MMMASTSHCFSTFRLLELQLSWANGRRPLDWDMLYNMGRYVVTWSTTHSHPPRMTTFSSHAQEQHSKLHFCLQFTLVELMSYSIVLYCGLLLLDYSHRMHEKKSVHAICTEMRSILRGVASEGFHSNMQKKDYRVRILHSRPFIKRETATEFISLCIVVA